MGRMCDQYVLGDDGLMIEVTNLTKRYGETSPSTTSASSDLPGVTGFLGPNGAGKSTTMRMILGLERPRAGTPPSTVAVTEISGPAQHVGALLDANAVHPGRSRPRPPAGARTPTGSGAPGSTRSSTSSAVPTSPADVRRVLPRHGPAARYRGGPARRPDVVMLDEPVNGLDPEGILWIRNLLRT